MFTSICRAPLSSKIHCHTRLQPCTPLQRHIYRSIMTTMDVNKAQDSLHKHNMYPNLNTNQDDARIIYPYVERNKEPILKTITPYIRQSSRGASMVAFSLLRLTLHNNTDECTTRSSRTCLRVRPTYCPLGDIVSISTFSTFRN